MYKKNKFTNKFNLIFIPFFISFFPFLKANENKTNDNKINLKNFEWEYTHNQIKEPNLNWRESIILNEYEINQTNKGELNKNILYKTFNHKNDFYDIKSYGKSVTINNFLYPDISSYVPNPFLDNSDRKFTFTFRGISKTRSCTQYSINCADSLLDTDINLFGNQNKSFGLKWTMQSLTSRNNGTKFGEAQSLGFKNAFRLSERWHLALGGDNIIHFDNKSDLGRNFYIVAGTFLPIEPFDSQSYLFLTGGIGSDFYGYRGNGFLGKTYCLGTPNLTGDGSDTCSWGPIGSISFVLNNRLSLITEWFGYGFGSGVSIRPAEKQPLTLSLMVTDYLGDFPNYIKEKCYLEVCQTRFYLTTSYSF